jgi:hypothetical protein
VVRATKGLAEMGSSQMVMSGREPRQVLMLLVKAKVFGALANWPSDLVRVGETYLIGSHLRRIPCFG